LNPYRDVEESLPFLVLGSCGRFNLLPPE